MLGLPAFILAFTLLILALSFSLVIALIAGLDRSTSGLITVTQQPLLSFFKTKPGNPKPGANP